MLIHLIYKFPDVGDEAGFPVGIQLVTESIPLFDGFKILKQRLQSLFKTMDSTVQEFKRLLVLDWVFDIVVLVFLVGLFGHQFGDEIGKLHLDGCGAFVVELVVAEVHQKTGKVVILVGDSQTQVLRNRRRHLVRVDAYCILVGQTQVMGETA